MEQASLCNCVVNFLLEENYLLTAFELLHELLEDGRECHATRLKEYFADTSTFPPDQISRLHGLRVLDPQNLLKEKEAADEKVAITEYELRLAQEDIMKLKTELEQRAVASSNECLDGQLNSSPGIENLSCQQIGGKIFFSNLGPLKDNERRDLNCAVKEFLLSAGYKLTAMTFYEEVTDQNLDVWQNKAACVPDALRRYYLQYLSSTVEAAEEKIAIIQEKEFLMRENDVLLKEKGALNKSKELADAQISALGRSLESAQKDIKDKDKQVQSLKESLELATKELNECRSEITSLKLQLEGSRATLGWDNSKNESLPTSYNDRLNAYESEIKKLQWEIVTLKGSASSVKASEELADPLTEDKHIEHPEMEIHEDKAIIPISTDLTPVSTHTDNAVYGNPSETTNKCAQSVESDLSIASINDVTIINKDDNGIKAAHVNSQNNTTLAETGLNSISLSSMGLDTIQVLADALPKIVPYVLINHREELLPLIMCAIERHPDNSTRDSLTHTLFNLIKRPDEQQRRSIMDACVILSKNVGDMRTETELLPQCWEQINHKYEERRLLVAQSCGELAEFVRPEIRTSLILSIVQQLVEDPAAVVREAAAHNLALLLPLFPNMDKYFKVEDLMFQLVCDPSGIVVDTSLKELVPAVINWGGKLEHILRVLLSHLLACAQRCPPLSGVDGSMEAHLRVLGEKERWNIDVLLRMLTELLPVLCHTSIETCPFPSHLSETSEPDGSFFSNYLLETYAREELEWPTFDWLHVDCLPALIQLTCLLPSREDSLRMRITKLLLAMAKNFGDNYLSGIMLPVFLTVVGDNVGTLLMPSSFESRIRGLKPKTAVSERLAVMCVLPLLLTGILGSHSRQAQLAEYLRSLILRSTLKHGAWTPSHTPELIDAVRFLCTFEEHHGIIVGVLWEMVVSTIANVKISAASIFKVLVAYVDTKVASTQILPALITLGSDPNLHVKYSSIDAFGAVAQHFKNEVIVDKIRVQMDAFLEDGSHEAAVAVVRALAVAVPLTTDRLRDYLLHKLFQLTTTTTQGTDLIRRRERANAFCEAIRALDATDLAPTSIRELLLPAIQNLLKDPDSLDPAHKEALEIIVRERSGGTLEALTKVMGSHLSMTSVSNIFGETGLLGKKDTGDLPDTSGQQLSQPEDNRFRRIMRANFLK